MQPARARAAQLATAASRATRNGLHLIEPRIPEVMYF
jgi:hypothetical protein